MKKEMMKRILVLCIFAIFTISLFSTFVLAQDADKNDRWSFPKSIGSIKNWFANWQEGQLDVNIAKFLFFVMIALIIYMIISQMFHRPYISWPVSIIIAFLSTAYITPNEVFSLLTAYTALGITISVFLPLVVLLAFTFVGQEISPEKIVIGYFIWIFFLAVLTYRLIAGIVTGEASAILNILIGVAMIVSLIVIMASSKIKAALGKEVTKQIAAAAQRRGELASAKVKGDAKSQEDLAEGK